MTYVLKTYHGHQFVFYNGLFHHSSDSMISHIFWLFLLQVRKKHGKKSKKKSVQKSKPKTTPTPTTQKQKYTYSHKRTRQQWICLIVAIILGIILLPLTLAIVIGFLLGSALRRCEDKAIEREFRKAYLEGKRQREAEEALASTSGMVVMECDVPSVISSSLVVISNLRVF